MIVHIGKQYDGGCGKCGGVIKNAKNFPLITNSQITAIYMTITTSLE